MAQTRPTRRRSSIRTYEPVAWRPPSPHRFDIRPANDWDGPTVRPSAPRLVRPSDPVLDRPIDKPHWSVAVVGIGVLSLVAIASINGLTL